MTCQEPVERRGHTQPCGRPVETGEQVCATHLRRQAQLAKQRPRSSKITHAAQTGR